MYLKTPPTFWAIFYRYTANILSITLIIHEYMNYWLDSRIMRSLQNWPFLLSNNYESSKSITCKHAGYEK